MYYVMFRGILRFQSEFNTYPGVSAEYEPDITRFKVSYINLNPFLISITS